MDSQDTNNPEQPPHTTNPALHQNPSPVVQSLAGDEPQPPIVNEHTRYYPPMVRRSQVTEPMPKQTSLETLEEEVEDKKETRFEMIAGIILAAFTAILALSGLAGDSYGQGVLLAEGEKASAYDWYQSKSIKQILTENQKNSLDSLILSGQLKSENNQKLQDYFIKLEEIIDSYEKQYGGIFTYPLADKGGAFQNADVELGKTIGAMKILIAENSAASSSIDNLKSYLDKLDQEIKRYNKEKKEILIGSANLDRKEWAQDVNGELGKVIGAQEREKELDVLNKAGAKMDLATLFLEICLVLGAISLVLLKRPLKITFLTICIIVGLIGTGFLAWGMYILWPF